MSINERIFYLIKLQNKKQCELSEYTGIKPSTITDWKKKGTNPSSDSIFKISEFFNVNTDWLLTGEGEMYKQTVNIQPKFYDSEELNVEEEILLETYKNSDRQTKKEILTFVVSKTFKIKSPKSKLYNSHNAGDEIVADYELQQLAS